MSQIDDLLFLNRFKKDTATTAEFLTQIINVGILDKELLFPERTIVLLLYRMLAISFLYVKSSTMLYTKIALPWSSLKKMGPTSSTGIYGRGD